MIFIYPQLDPVAIHIGSFGIHWYGIAYLLGFLWVWYMSIKTINHNQMISKVELENLLTSLMLCLLAGGRIGYMLFYQPVEWLHEPLMVFKIWHGGMSFHGALLGTAIGVLWQSCKLKLSFLKITDLIIPWVPLGIGLGRLANFINAELWGRPTYANWGMIFPMVDLQPRHPSQIYEFLGEGLLLSIIMYIAYKKSLNTGKMTALFLLSYGLIRFTLEYFREPDYQIGLLFNSNFSLGQLLTIPLILIGFILWKKN